MNAAQSLLQIGRQHLGHRGLHEFFDVALTGQYALGFDSRLARLGAQRLNRGGQVRQAESEEYGSEVLTEAESERLKGVGVVNEFGQYLCGCGTAQAVFPEQIGVKAGDRDGSHRCPNGVGHGVGPYGSVPQSHDCLWHIPDLVGEAVPR